MKTSKLYAPRTGFGRLAGDMIRRYYVHDVARDSAALTYYLLFAIFPLLIFVSTLLGVLELDIASITAVLAPILPSDVVDIIRTYLEYVAANQSRQLLWFSLVFSIWFPMRSTGCLMHSLRKAFGRSAPENILLGQLRTLLFTIWMIFVIGLTLALVVVGRRALYFLSGFLPLSETFISVWGYLRFIILGLVMAISLGILYQLALGQRRPLREVLPGVGSSLAAWLLLSMAFSYYVENMARYAQLYGSIATIVVVLLWLYMSGQVLILGAELSASLIHRKKHAAPSSGGEEEA
ncbi:MAG: YihY/virulence factor BrkB family protein [Oscillospiraceae bacterium]|jgi:membrane protein|nr:YihY/virulence factor BrkB family protein [Clostridiales bacterium]MBS1433658.1 YihY/virulence factor BrkB family protein [Oscillospiraceae bacterium]MDR3896516.1 YihY/virulence factor BrkB family protein [Oscillospiraceae bacterium]